MCIVYNLQSNGLGWYTKQFLFNFQLNHVSWAPTLSFLTCAPICVSCRPTIITQMSHCSKMCQGYPASESPTEWAGEKLLFSLFCFISPDLFLGTFVICCPCSCLSAAYFITPMTKQFYKNNCHSLLKLNLILVLTFHGWWRKSWENFYDETIRDDDDECVRTGAGISVRLIV